MTTEVQTPEVEVQDQSTPEQDDAAFAAGFADARGEEPPAPVEPEVPPGSSEEQDAEEVADLDPPDPEDTPSETFAGLTREQLMEGLAKALKAEEDTRKAFGKIGELHRVVQSLQQNGSGQAVELTKDDFADLAEDYPDLAEKIAKGISGKLKTVAAPQGPAIDTTQFDQRLQEVETKLEQKYEMKLLSVMHPDWREVSDSNDFQVWKGTLPKEVQLELDRSWDSTYIGSALTEFKNWRSKSVQTKQERASRLEAAVTPQGAPAKGGLSDDDAFNAGWKNVRGR